jgi:phenylacetate-CoA ligase
MRRASSVSGMSRGALPLDQAGLTASLAELMNQLERTQWLSTAAIEQHQYQQLVRLASYAAAHSAQFRSRLQSAGMRVAQLATAEGLRGLAVLSRRHVQEAGDSLFCDQLPHGHKPVGETRTSGSTGETVVVRRTAINQLYWYANTLREHAWYKRDSMGRLAIIRADLTGGPAHLPNWGRPVNLFFNSGTAHTLLITTDLAEQIEWLKEVDPDYLLTYPTNLLALARECLERGIRLPRLHQVRTIGETLGEHVRTATRAAFGVEIVDSYSSQEAGVIAVQCPHSGLYHIMAESVIVEVLNADGRPCIPGEIGKVVVTDLHNFATPLIRYAIGDYAEVGPACACGRGLPTLRRVVGRERNMVWLPDGRRHWPLVGAHHYHEIAPIRQYQLIQRSHELVEVRLVADRALTEVEESRLGALVHKAIRFPFSLEFVYFNGEIPCGASGKYEEFVCEVK